MRPEEIDLEEVLLAYLRSSKKIQLAKLEVDKSENQSQYTIVFKVDNDFPGNLTKDMGNPFFDFFKQNVK